MSGPTPDDRYDTSHIPPLRFRTGNGHAEEERPSPQEPENPYDAHILPEVDWLDRRASDRGDEPVPPRQWVVPDWIPREQVTGLYGPPGTNKTDFLIQLLMATSVGLPFMGYQLERMPAFGLFCEDTVDEIDRRIARVAEHYGMWVSEFPDFHYASLVGYSDLEFVQFAQNSMFDTRALKRFDMTIAQIRPGLACLDTAPHFFGGSEIDRRQVSRFLRKLDAISITRGCGIVISAHPSARGAKTGGRMDSGSTGWEGGVRARIALTKPSADDDEEGKPPTDTNDRTLTLWKSNYAPPGKAIDLVWNKGVFTTGALDPEKARARGPHAKEACRERFIELLRKTIAIGKHVNDSSNHKGTYAPEVFANHPDGKPFRRDQYLQAMRDLEASGRIRYVEKYRRRVMEEAQPEGDSATQDTV